MQPAANTSASVPEQTIQPKQKTGAFIGKIKNTATALVAGLGLVSSAEAGEVQKIGLPNSTISGPTLIQGTAISQDVTGVPSYNSRLYDGSPDVNDTSIDRITINLSAADIGSGGKLTITGTMTGGTRGGVVGTSPGYGFTVGEQFRVQHQAQFGLAGGSMATIAAYDSGLRVNGGADPAFDGESWSHNDTFSYSIDITQPGIYNLDNILIRQNSTGNAQFSDFKLSYLQNAKLVNIDTNKNSIPDKWEYDNFGMLTPADGDPDHDGMNNLVEYAMNTNPTVANVSPITGAIENGENGQKYLTLSFPKNPEATHLNYTVESSTDLQNWNTLAVTQITQTKVIDTVPVTNQPKRFLRLKVDPKP